MNKRENEDTIFRINRMMIEVQYEKIGAVYCPYLGDDVHFGAKRLENLKFKGRRRARTRLETKERLLLLRFAPMILGASHTVQELRTSTVRVRIRAGGRRAWEHKLCVYFGFVAVFTREGRRKSVKVVVRQVDGGRKHFWNVAVFRKRRMRETNLG